MCCIQVSAEVLLDNFFGCSLWNKQPYRQVTVEQISQCGIFLVNSLPGYACCETNETIIRQAAAEAGYSIDPIKQTICKGNKEVDRRKQNSIYTQRTAKYIESLVDIYVKQKLEQAEGRIEQLKVICA